MDQSCTHVVAGMFPITITEQGSWKPWGRSEVSRKVINDCADFYVAALHAIDKLTFGLWQPGVRITPVEHSILYRVGGQHTG